MDAPASERTNERPTKALTSKALLSFVLLAVANAAFGGTLPPSDLAITIVSAANLTGTEYPAR